MTIRAAAVQFATTTDPAENLDTCLRMLRAAAKDKPQLIVLPEFCNHLSWYDDREHARRMALDLDGPWLRAIADEVRAAGATLRDGDGDRVTGTNLVFAPDGSLAARSDKKILMGAEGDFLDPGDQPPGPVIDTPIGRLGTYACMEGVITELARCLALDRAQVLMNSLNSFALDEAELHIPVRAAENKVFVVAANKVGPLIPPEHIQAVSDKIGIPVEMLHGAGESQVVAPDGSVLAKGPRAGEAVVVAEFDPSAADDKRFPDGTDAMGARRAHAYAPLAAHAPPRPAPGPEAIEVAAVAPRATGSEAIGEAATATKELAANGVALIVLPELFFAGDDDDLEALGAGSSDAVAALGAAIAGTEARVAFSIVTPFGDQGVHAAVLLSAEGIEGRQSQIHPSAAYPWASEDLLASGLNVVETPHGRIAVAPGSDVRFPEVARLAGIARAEVLAVPARIAERWETELGLVERAAENRVNLVAASRDTGAGGSLIASIQPDSSLWSERTRPFDGRINMPDVVRAEGGETVLRARIHPARAANTTLSKNTDLVDGRPWRLVGALTE